MTKRMLVDATHPEETRVAIVDDRRLEDFDFESASKKQLKGNIYLAKVIRIEPSLQAAFVEYGGNRHGFLPFSEIHPDYFRIPMADRPHGDDDDQAAYDQDDEFEPAGVSAEAYAEEIRAYAADVADHDHDHSHIDHPLLDPSLENTDGAHAVSDVPPPDMLDAPALVDMDTGLVLADPDVKPHSVTAEFGVDPVHDLGLITDFGNAAIDDSFVPAPPAERIGEVADEVEDEQRVRRMPRARSYKIQEVVKRRQIMLIQVVKEERGNKGAALTTFLSLAGRYCVLMPNTDRGGGVSRKITSHQDRKRMKDMLDQLETPEGMAVILRTAGMEQEPVEIQRDLEHLLRLWNNIREQTLASTAPTLIYEEANLIKRSIRDLFAADVEEILVAGAKGHTLAHDFMRSIMPEETDRVRLYDDAVPLFFRYNVEKQIDQLYNPVVQLRSGGYIVINPTEALVSIDVNSGRATRERHIESTALKTNIEAADEIARQLRLRDLAGLVVIDFIDMEDGRNNAAVERRMKEAMKADRARLQIGRISPFGLMELSRQRLHPSLTEINFEKCNHCAGVGLVRSVDSSSISILRMIEEEGIKQTGGEIILHVPTAIALYILNQKRAVLHGIEQHYSLQVFLRSDDTLVPPDFKMERARAGSSEARSPRAPAVNNDRVFAEAGMSDSDDEVMETPRHEPRETAERPTGDRASGDRASGDRNGDRNNRRRGRFGRGRDRNDRNDRGGDRPNNRDRTQDRPQAGQGYDPDSNGNSVIIDTLPDDNIGNAVGVDNASALVARVAQESLAHESVTHGSVQNGPVYNGDPSQDPRHAGRRRGRRGGRGRRHGGNGENRGENRGEGRYDNRPDSRPDHTRPDQNSERPVGENPVGENLGSGRREYVRHEPSQREPSQREPHQRESYQQQHVTTPMPVTIPLSIHDIDTTPREYSAPRPSPASVPTPVSAAPNAPPPYNVNQQSNDEKPKGGWWRKLTGQ